MMASLVMVKLRTLIDNVGNVGDVCDGVGDDGDVVSDVVGDGDVENPHGGLDARILSKAVSAEVDGTLHNILSFQI